MRSCMAAVERIFTVFHRYYCIKRWVNRTCSIEAETQCGLTDEFRMSRENWLRANNALTARQYFIILPAARAMCACSKSPEQLSSISVRVSRGKSH